MFINVLITFYGFITSTLGGMQSCNHHVSLFARYLNHPKFTEFSVLYLLSAPLMSEDNAICYELRFCG